MDGMVRWVGTWLIQRLSFDASLSRTNCLGLGVAVHWRWAGLLPASRAGIHGLYGLRNRRIRSSRGFFFNGTSTRVFFFIEYIGEKYNPCKEKARTKNYTLYKVRDKLAQSLDTR